MNYDGINLLNNNRTETIQQCFSAAVRLFCCPGFKDGWVATTTAYNSG